MVPVLGNEAVSRDSFRSRPVVGVIEVEHDTNQSVIANLLNVLPVIVDKDGSSKLSANIVLLLFSAGSVVVAVVDGSKYVREVAIDPASSKGLKMSLTASNDMELEFTTLLQLAHGLMIKGGQKVRNLAIGAKAMMRLL